MKRKTQKRRLFNKKAGASVGTAIKVLTSVVLGAAMLAGTYGIVKTTVVPTTKSKVSSMFEVTDDVLAEAGGVIPTVDKFGDGPCSYFYYDTLQNAVADASVHTTENANADESTGKAFIAVRQSDDVYIVKPTEDQIVSSSISMSNKMIFDANGKQIELAAGAELKPTENSDITFRDSGNGKIYKDVNSANTEKLINAKSITTSTITILNGSYEVKNKTKSAYLISSDGTFNSEGGNFFAYTEGGSCIVLLNSTSKTPIVNISGGEYKSISKNNSAYIMNLLGTANITGGNFSASKYSNTTEANAVCIFVSKDGSLKTSGCTFSSESINGFSYCIWNHSSNINGSVEINGGVFESSTADGKSYGIYGAKIINNATIRAYATNNSGTNEAKVYGVLIPSSLPNAEISNTNISVDYNVLGVNEYVCQGIQSILGTTNLVINDCYVKAVREALSLGCSNVFINGGTYEGVQHGGAYFCCEKAVVKDATFRQWNYDGKYNRDNIYSFSNNASFYVGVASYEVRVFMNNCRVENATNSVLSSAYNHKNTYLYASNTAFNNIRIDGVNSNGDKGHMYVGKGCTYNSTSGSGDLDTTTYSSVEFTPEYVQNNFS